MKIVWIDDDAWVLRPLVERLEWDGHQVRPVRNVGEALATVDDWRDCDVLLLDVILPPGNAPDEGLYSGVPLLRDLRKKHHVTAPAIILSVVDSARMGSDLEGLGVVAKMRKPTLPSMLRETLGTAVKSDRVEAARVGTQLNPVGN